MACIPVCVMTTTKVITVTVLKLAVPCNHLINKGNKLYEEVMCNGYEVN